MTHKRKDRHGEMIGSVFVTHDFGTLKLHTSRVDHRKRADGRGRAVGRRAGVTCAAAWRRAHRPPAALRRTPAGAAVPSARAPPARPPAAARAPLPRHARDALAKPTKTEKYMG